MVCLQINNTITTHHVPKYSAIRLTQTITPRHYVEPGHLLNKAKILRLVATCVCMAGTITYISYNNNNSENWAPCQY